MKGFTATVTDPVGMHARPAVVVVNAAKCFESKITMKYNNKIADVKSIMNLVSLGVPTHVEIEVYAEGPDEDLAVEVMKKTLVHEGIIETAAERIYKAGLKPEPKPEAL